MADEQSEDKQETPESSQETQVGRKVVDPHGDTSETEAVGSVAAGDEESERSGDETKVGAPVVSERSGRRPESGGGAAPRCRGGARRIRRQAAPVRGGRVRRRFAGSPDSQATRR